MSCGDCRLCMGWLANAKPAELPKRKANRVTSSNSEPTTALETIGTLLPVSQERDAVHLAVVNVEAGEKLFPGQDILLVDGKAVSEGTVFIGIVDPFLDGPVFPGQRFWLMLYPRTITSLKHVWTHPAFGPEEARAPRPSTKDESEAWLREFIAGADCPSYETVIAKATDNDSWDSEYLHFSGQDAHGDIPPEFWDHVEIVTGVTIAAAGRASYFSCGC